MTPRWLIPLGRPSYPAGEIANLLDGLGFSVESVDDALYWGSAALDSEDSLEDAVNVATQMVDSVNGYVQLIWPGFLPVQFSDLLKLYEDGRVERSITATPTLVLMAYPEEPIASTLYERGPAMAGYVPMRPRRLGHSKRHATSCDGSSLCGSATRGTRSLRSEDSLRSLCELERHG